MGQPPYQSLRPSLPQLYLDEVADVARVREEIGVRLVGLGVQPWAPCTLARSSPPSRGRWRDLTWLGGSWRRPRPAYSAPCRSAVCTRGPVDRRRLSSRGCGQPSPPAPSGLPPRAPDETCLLLGRTAHSHHLLHPARERGRGGMGNRTEQRVVPFAGQV